MFSDESSVGVARAADEWLSPRRFAALLAALVCLSYPDVVFGFGTFFHRDYAVFGYPLAAYHRACFWRGEFALWNPYNHCGVPFLAQWNTMTLYPLSLFYLLLPIPWSLGIFCLGHFYLGGMGMYFLARRWTDNSFAGAVAGVAYPFTALMLHALMWPNNISALGWLPWVVLFTGRAWQEGGRYILLATLVGTVQMLAGAPEVILLTWVLVGVLFAGELILAQSQRLTMLRRFLVCGCWVGLLSAAQLLPFLDLLKHSQRDPGFAGSMWAMPIWGWANLVVPLFRTFRTALGIYVQPEQFWVSSYYLGVGTLSLALLGATHVRKSRVLLLSALTLLCLVLALGEKGLLYPIMKRFVPGLGFMRYPIKFIILPTVLVPLLSAIAMNLCLMASPENWAREKRKIYYVFGTLVLLMGLHAWFAYHRPLEGASASVAAISAATRVVFLTAILAAVVALRVVQTPRWALAARVGLLLLLWLDAMTAGPRPNPTAPLWVYQPNRIRQELGLNPSATLGQTRVMLNAEAEQNMNSSPLTNAAQQVIYTRLALFADINLLDDIPKVLGMYSLYFRESGDVFGELWTPKEPPAGLADFLSVAQINEPGRATFWKPRPNYLPWVTAGQKPELASQQEILSAMGKPDFDPRKIVFLPTEMRGIVTVSNPTPATVSNQRFSPHKVEFDVSCEQPCLTVISQSFYHNWQPYVDGHRVPLLRANYAFQAVQMPAGQRHVVVVYEDRAFIIGALISLAATVLWVGFWWRLRKLTSRLAAAR